MRAVSYAQFGGPEVLHVADVPMPEPGPDRVLVAVHTLAGGRGGVLSCRVGTGRCVQVALGEGGRSPDLVLSR